MLFDPAKVPLKVFQLYLNPIQHAVRAKMGWIDCIAKLAISKAHYGMLLLFFPNIFHILGQQNSKKNWRKKHTFQEAYEINTIECEQTP